MDEASAGTAPGSIRAAGGIVLGSGDREGRIAVVRRRRYAGEVALPKGKLRAGESAADAALREVTEETGCRARIRDHAGTTHYVVGTTPKEVTYFLMETTDGGCDSPEDKDEIASVEWVTPQRAAAVLTHPEDRQLVAAVFKIDRSPA
jgi:8-oxo-dGTP diphosphatase